MRKGQVQQGDFHRFAEITQQHAGVPLSIEPTSDLSIDAIRTWARHLKRQYGIGLLIIDYLQLLRGTHSPQTRQNCTVEVSEIIHGLKAVTKDLNIPVLALSQPSHDVEKHEDKCPPLADLRDSGTIEQDADVVSFMYREEYYLSRDEPQQCSVRGSSIRIWTHHCAKFLERRLAANLALRGLQRCLPRAPVATVAMRERGRPAPPCLLAAVTDAGRQTFGVPDASRPPITASAVSAPCASPASRRSLCRMICPNPYRRSADTPPQQRGEERDAASWSGMPGGRATRKKSPISPK
jgi:DnaB-like helicase C terminal domain